MVVPHFPGFAAAILLLLQVSPLGSAAAEPIRESSQPEALRGPVDFNRDVRPILNQHCIACHGGVKQAADLSFVYQDQALRMLEPGDADSSYLIERVTSEDEEYRMPPPGHGRALSAAEVLVLRQWIDEGAEWQRHWAFEPPQRQTPPGVGDPASLRTPIDNFVRARLPEHDLEPSADAVPDRWLRRVSLDLTGIPPTPQQRDAFLQAVERQGERAYQDAVDRLLASPRFGHRWASVWLDQVRYADSKGLGQDGRRTIWKYRDWVIEALNRDLPYDQFTIQQIAGDLLPRPGYDDLVATACQRLTQTNEEGGTDDEQFRIEAVIDRVNTTWQVWQGLSFGCAQCHSHPYEPIRHEEYYEFLAFFNNTVDTDLSSDEPHVQVPLEEERRGEALRLDREIVQLEEQLWQAEAEHLFDAALWQPLDGLTATTTNATEVAVERREGHEEYRTVGTVSRDTGIVLEAPLPAGLEQLTAIRFTGLPLNPATAAADSEIGFVISHFAAQLLAPDADAPQPIELIGVIADEPHPLNDPALSLNAKDPQGFGAYTRIYRPRSVAFVLGEPLALPPGSRLQVTLQHNVFDLGAFPLVARRGRLDVTGDGALTGLQDDPSQRARREQLAEARKLRCQIASVSIPVMRQRPQHLARTTNVFERGNFLDKGAVVQPGLPDTLPPLDAAESPSRLDFARWLVSAENPLTARVAVNRIWAQMFGAGLVETQEDFGASGQLPSHPRLLEDLAVRFRDDMQWSTKRLLREIALSSTYRQAAEAGPEKRENDPANRWLSRGPRRRLPAETIRDAALAASGLLSEQVGGPPVHPPIPEGVWMPFQASDKWQTPPPGEAERYRRSVYTYTKRTIPYPMFATFDAPSREFCTSRRLPSNTPLQALMTLNDVAFLEASRALARRMIDEGEARAEQLAYGVLAVLGRRADGDELAELERLYERTLDQLRINAHLEGHSKAERELEAMTNVASVLLNLDEALCN